MGKLVTE